MQKVPVRLLIAEDEDAIRESIEKYIRANTRLVDEIYTAENGRQALDIILRYRPQAMILDIQMPLKDGLAVMHDALAANICPRTVIMSGHDQFSYAQQALRYGAVDYLLKPCRATDILATVEKLVRDACTPGTPPPQTGGDRRHAGGAVDEALEYMRAHYHENLTLPQVAENIGISPNYLSTLFAKTANAGFTGALNQIRIDRACDYFAAGGMHSYEVAYKVGFKDEKYFAQVFKKLKGESPSEYRKNK